MRVTYNWLKDFVDIKIPPQALADKLTMAGLEVISLEERQGDHVFEIEITSNRPDWLSVIGVAREVAAITGKKMKVGAIRKPQFPSKKPHSAIRGLQLKIESKKDCPLYIGTIITGVQVGPSPEWLRRRLELVGCRSVNNIVDITNYCLFETGEPLHAFDLDKLFGRQDTKLQSHRLEIQVRRAKAGEKITTIDGVERTLDREVLVIADAQNPIALAGIMGGRDTEVSGATKRILLEAAVFNSQLIRRGRRILGVQSEAAYRFERSVAPPVAQEASARALGLIEKIASGRAAIAHKAGSLPGKKTIVRLDTAALAKFLGAKVTSLKAGKILSSLGFKVKGVGNSTLSVEVPPHRQDVTTRQDLAEEIARIYGYDCIPKTFPAVRPAITLDPKRTLQSLIKNILAGLGLQEVITYSLISKDVLLETRAQAQSMPIEILNPLSKEQEILRPLLLPGILNCVALNLNRKQEHVAIFEIAPVFTCVGGSLNEELTLSIGLCGTKTLLLKQGAIKDEPGYLHLKGVLCAVLERLGLKDRQNYSVEDASMIWINIGAARIGFFARPAKASLEQFGIKNRDVFTLEVSLQKLFALADLKKKFLPLAIYPAVRRDISIVVKADVDASSILEEIRRNGMPWLEKAEIIDYYQGKQIAAGQKSLTISCAYRAAMRTLTEAEINPVHSAICAALSMRFQAQFRS